MKKLTTYKHGLNTDSLATEATEKKDECPQIPQINPDLSDAERYRIRRAAKKLAKLTTQLEKENPLIPKKCKGCNYFGLGSCTCKIGQNPDTCPYTGIYTWLNTNRR
jgi:hypothetical protein